MIMPPSSSQLRCALAATWSGLRRDRRGNVLMIFAFAIGPITFATGMGIDYGAAMRMQTKLAAAADAAALSAVSKQMMTATTAAAVAKAKLMFNLQVSGTPRLVINFNDPAQFNVTVTDTAGAQNIRTATVTFKGKSTNTFARILGLDTLPIRGTTVAKASTAPDIDFYLMMDTSPSMALPITTAGLNQLTSLTGNCAFACHSVNDKTAYDKTGKLVSYYKVAQSYSIPLRVDAEIKAAQSMMSLATTTGQDNDATYRAALYSFDVKNNFKTLSPLTSNLTTASTKAANATLLQVYSNNMLTQNNSNSDQDTDFSDMFTNALAKMPTSPGNGTGQGTDTPQAMMFLITDGMRDESYNNGRALGAIPTSYCDTIKNRGIRIAILYTEYLPAAMSDDWSKQNALPLLPNIEPALQRCASSGLYYKVTTDGDISAALASLFQKAVQTARLTQ
jgi:Flp pilus assembly protein TadG